MSSPISTRVSASRLPATLIALPRKKPSRGKIILIVLVVVAALILCLVGILYSKIWPFSRESVVEDLAEASDSMVTLQNFHRTYFPPGCILEGLEFRHNGDRTRLFTIERLEVEGSYIGILRHHVPRINAVGAKIFVPTFGSHIVFKTEHSDIVVDEIVANGSFVEFQSNDPHKKPLRFDVHEALLSDVRWGNPIGYRLKLHNPEPPGELAVQGKFGGWATGHPSDTPLSGEYNFEHADLGVYGGIAGTLASKGKFDGTLGHVNIAGTTDVPNFVVTSGGHKVRLQTKFDAYVDATRGDTFLKRVDAHFGRTTVIAEGSIASSPGRKGKIADIHLTSRRGRIEDLLGLFVNEPRSPMSGEVSLQAHTQIPPGSEPFLQKVKLQGAFGIDAGNFSKPNTQEGVNQLSAGARGESMENPETVLTDLTGQVDLNGGVARFTDLRFSIPGAKARMQGTFNIINEKIDLHGRMRVDTKISKTATGVKSLLLRLMDPIFKKKKKGEVVPVHIGGTYEKPQFGLDLTSQPDTNPNHPKQPTR